MIIKIPYGEEMPVIELSLNNLNGSYYFDYSLKLNDVLIASGDSFRPGMCAGYERMHMDALILLMEKIRHIDYGVADLLELMIFDYEQDGVPFWEED
jgi:hypothetical protein